MKKSLLKSILLSFIWLGMLSNVSAQGIVVKKTDGSKVFFKASEVVSVGVFGYGEGPDDSPKIHEWVDLGLPSGTLWATTNVGAEKPEDYGNYFAWGETIGYDEGKTTFDWSTYKYYDMSFKVVTKYCTKSANGSIDNKTELEPEDDAATVNWGNDWQMPSLEQMKELINSNYTTTTWTTLNGVQGRLVVSKNNGNRIFLPAAGYHPGTSLSSAGSYATHWSRSLDTSNSSYGYYLYFNSSSFGTSSTGSRSYGNSVRPVRVQK